MEFAYEIFDGDQLFVLAYDEKAEIVQEWTDDAKKMEASLATFRKKGNPYLVRRSGLDRQRILLPLMPGTRKTAIVVIGDGVDRGSKTSFQTRFLDGCRTRMSPFMLCSFPTAPAELFAAISQRPQRL